MSAPAARAAAHGERLPPDYYTDRAMFDQASERLFARAWHFACHASNVPEPGDFLAFELLGEPLFVVRGEDGVPRCFYNVCQHRGHPVVNGAGHARRLVCPYHAWSYTPDGRLARAPGSDAMPCFDGDAVRLTEVRLESFLGFLFVNLDDDAPAMRAVYPEVEAAVREHCPDIESRVFAHEHVALEPCNWLVALENYNECYHCRHVHRSFSEGIVDPAGYDIQPFGDGRVLRHAARAATGAGRWYDTAGAGYASFYLFPLFSLQLYPGGLVNTYYWRPLDVARTFVHRGWFSVDGAVDADLARVIDLDRETTFAEDLVLVEGVQRGVESRGYRPAQLIVSPEGGISSEHPLLALHGWVRESVG